MLKQQLQQWYAEEREKLQGMSPAKAAQYIWTYYKLWIIGFVVAVVVIVYFAVHYATTLREDWFYACYANVPAIHVSQLEDGGSLYADFAQYAGYDLSEKNLIFDANCYCKPSETPYNNHYFDKLVALIESGKLDVLIMEGSELQAMGTSGRLMDLQGGVYTIDDRWADRLLYCENTDESYGKTKVPVAVDLSGSVLTEPDGPYPDGCAVSLGAYAPHPDQFEVFLTFLLEENVP